MLIHPETFLSPQTAENRGFKATSLQKKKIPAEQTPRNHLSNLIKFV